MCTHNIKDARANKTSKKLGDQHKFYNSILNMEPVKLLCINSVELKDASETSQIKTKLG